MSEQTTQAGSAPAQTKPNLAIALMTDFLLVFSGLVFDFPFLLVFPPSAIVIAAVIIALLWLRRKPRYRKNFAVNLVFFLFVILTIDVIVLMQIALYGWLPVLVAATPLSYLAALLFRKHPALQWDRVQALIVPLIVAFLLSTASNAPQSRGDCGRISKTPGVKLLYEFPTKTTVRFVLRPLGRDGLLVSHRKGFMIPQPNFVPRTLDYISPASGDVKEWLSKGEVIGMYQPPAGGDIYTVVIDSMPDRKKGESYLDIVIFSPDGRLKRRVGLPNARSDYYTASVFQTRDELVIFVEWNIFKYNIKTGRAWLARENKDFSPYYMTQYKDNLYGVSCKSPLIMLTAPWVVMKYDMKNYALAGKLRGGMFGYYDIHQVGQSPTFAASYVWIGGGILFDENLKIIKNLKLPRGIRNIGVDPSGKHIFAPNIATGMMSVLDIAKNKLLPGELFVGKGARSMNDTKDGKIILGNSCGLVEIDPAAAAKAAAESPAK